MPSESSHLTGSGDRISAVGAGRSAVADALQQHLPHKNRATAMKLASECIDAWLLASNPVGEPETIYDEFYRLREAARLALGALGASHTVVEGPGAGWRDIDGFLDYDYDDQPAPDCPVCAAESALRKALGDA